jgi:drug/metabolite transporter (DMT)-like permease
VAISARATENPPTASSLTAPTAPVEARHVAWLLALGTIWGSSFLFVKVLVEEASPSAMIAVRIALGAATLGVALLARGQRLPARGPIWGHLLVMSVCGNVVPFLLIAWGQRHASSALGAVLNATIPLFTLLLAAFVYRIDHITPSRLAGIALGFTGVAFLTGPDILDVGSNSGLGELALLGSNLCYGFAFAYARRHIRGDPLSNVTAQLLMSLALVLPLALRGGWVRVDELSPLEIGAWLLLSILGTGVAYLFYYSLIAQIGAVRASLTTYLIPVVGVVLGWLVLDEYLGPWGLFGMLLIVCGIAISYGWHAWLLRQRESLR